MPPFAPPTNSLNRMHEHREMIERASRGAEIAIGAELG
jgi:hypothetical protein